ncbi:OstA-like protein [Hydrogenovibrio marinus]|uniref:Lipopolysaccharide export system protein LptA n=2 Tax=Hydrogenovibrio marinus TaxID=28885 RepID=A0A066ZZ00_HYDMR|nr:OstA-like protein [Hydrogenovibrio marinus]BBN59826.1 lipopolysaccharide export system protein LptA [Hydrogenovibrio marinus]
MRDAFTLLLMLSMLFTAFSAHAENTANTSDENLPVEVTADSLNAKDKEGVSIYQGNVVITQGTTTIKGDKVTLHHPHRKISTAIVIGKPATFKRYLEEEKGWVTGHADKITYSAAQKTLLLEGHAQVIQEGKNSISGPKILYDLTLKTLSAKGEKQDRIKMIFTPDEQEQK